ncbi:hypothetical protein CRG98_030200 [Punica granatum]|uniref:Uncharacterized protein n=1 Tax=Punica granatum TaxID=22663 RepID=A0A2I0IZH5_PUNGR|nr:hypothetical protein CRG98_030200 [Punica granatum]
MDIGGGIRVVGFDSGGGMAAGRVTDGGGTLAGRPVGFGSTVGPYPGGRVEFEEVRFGALSRAMSSAMSAAI